MKIKLTNNEPFTIERGEVTIDVMELGNASSKIPYVIDDTVKVGTVQNPYTGFLLNGSPYLLRGVCMHDDIEDKANALTNADYNQTFSIIQELGCNFLRLAHYPHPKEVYDRCDQLGIIV